MRRSRRLINALSLSRIGIGMLFVLSFQRRPALLYVPASLCLMAFVTDILDGYLSRRLHIASIHGRLWDSLGDKSFYIAVIIAFDGQGFLYPLLSWGLIVREIVLYITRILYIEKLPKIEQIRALTNWHGYFMYLTIVSGLVGMYAELRGLPVSVYALTQVAGSAALMCGLGNVFQFLKIPE